MCRGKDVSRLLEDKKDTEKIINSSLQDLKELRENGFGGNLVDRAEGQIEIEEINAKLEIYRDKLSQINLALAETPSDLGVVLCIDCHNPIPEERLKEIPQAMHCALCQSKQDKIKNGTRTNTRSRPIYIPA